MPGDPIAFHYDENSQASFVYTNCGLFKMNKDSNEWQWVELKPFYRHPDQEAVGVKPSSVFFDPELTEGFLVIGTVNDSMWIRLFYYDIAHDSTHFIRNLSVKSEVPLELSKSINKSGKVLRIKDPGTSEQVEIDLGELNKNLNTRNWEFKPIDFDGVFSIEAHPGNPDTVVLHGPGGLYISHDGGDSWDRKIEGYVGCVAFNPHKPDEVHVITDFEPSEHMISDDRGKTWRLAHTFKDMTVTDILFDRKDPSVMYFGHHDADYQNLSGITRLSQKGYEFSPFGSDYMGLLTHSLAQDSDGSIYAGTEIFDHPGLDEGTYRPPLFRSTDGGQTWKEITGPIGWHVSGITVDDERGAVYAQTEGGSLYRSYDRGDSWEFAASGWGFNNGPFAQHSDGKIYSPRYFSFYKPVVGGLYRLDEVGEWQVHDLAYRSIVDVSTDNSDFVYALERGSRSIGIYRKKQK